MNNEAKAWRRQIDIKDMVQYASMYRHDIESIPVDDYWQYDAAEANNHWCAMRAIEVATKLGIAMTEEEFKTMADTIGEEITAEIAVINYINSKTKKETKTMSKNTKSKNDYTMGGIIEATNWTEFKAVCKEHGINCGTKKFNELSVELSTILSTKAAPAEEVKPEEFVVNKNMGDAIVRRIMLGGKDRNGRQHSAAAFKATKSKDPSVNGHMMVTMAKLYAIIADVYGLQQGNPNNDAFIKKCVINYLCKHGWLNFKKYEGGALSFFPTQKMMSYKFQ